MGLDDFAGLPDQFCVVWCLFPQKGGKNEPGDVARPALILDVRQQAETKAVKVLVAYGTGFEHKDSPLLDGGPDLEIDTWPAVKALGLHKPTIFSMWPSQRRWLAWSRKYFVPQAYLVGRGIVAGNLNPFQVARVKQCFRERGLEAFWPI
jgi:hypothetical protein